jgi:hypothetical protein
MEVSPGMDLEAAINALGPGDELIVHGGTYDVTAAGRFSVDIAGTAAMPIVIRAADGETPIVVRGDASQNLIDFVGIEHTTIRGIEFVGGSAGLRFSAGRFVTIEECDVHDTADVAIRANDGGVTYEGFRILGNEVHHTNGTGEGMYLGCNSNGCQFVNALIEGNYVHHTNQAGVEQGDGIEIKEGSYGNVVRGNVIHDTNYPCILTYSTVGGEPNLIEQNVMWNCGDHAIQSAADATIRNNIILGAVGDGIAMQPHQAGIPSRLVVVHNTIVHPSGTAISVRSANGPVVLANNALYAMGGQAIFVSGSAATIVAVGNVGIGGAAVGTLAPGSPSADFVMATFSGGVPNDVFPRPGSALIGAGDAMYVPADDFNGTARGGVADVGAYRYDAAGNPGWTLAEGFRDSIPVMPGSDAGPMPGVDAAVLPGTDAGTVPGTDAGTATPPSSGCGCRASAGSSAGALAWLLAPLLLLRRRR